MYSIIIYKCSNEDLDQHMNFCTYQIWTNADTVGLNSALINVYTMYMGAEMALANLHICIGSTEPSLCQTAINTKT